MAVVTYRDGRQCWQRRGSRGEEAEEEEKEEEEEGGKAGRKDGRTEETHAFSTLTVGNEAIYHLRTVKQTFLRHSELAIYEVCSTYVSVLQS